MKIKTHVKAGPSFVLNEKDSAATGNTRTATVDKTTATCSGL